MAVPTRLASIDVVRGAVMVLMAVDHVRVYSGIPAGGPSPGIFFTRWITHFCAPVFVFLAGTSAYLLAERLGDKGRLSQRLAGRGLMLVLLELTVIRASWTFGMDYSQFLLAGVIWMIGWSMLLLAALVWLPVPAVGAIGVAMVVLQPLFATLGRALPLTWHPAWELIYPIGAELTLGGGPRVATLYTLVPWAGVMCAGYGFGAIVAGDRAARRRRCLTIGLGATVLFLALAGVEAITAPGDAPFVLRLLNQRKYPASVPFLLMTLGPAIVGLGVIEGRRGGAAAVLETFGRVPMAYYLLHVPLIHALSLIVWRLRGTGVDDAAFATAPYVSLPDGQRWELWLLYVVFGGVVAILYPICRALGRAEGAGRARWLRYL